MAKFRGYNLNCEHITNHVHCTVWPKVLGPQVTQQNHGAQNGFEQTRKNSFFLAFKIFYGNHDNYFCVHNRLIQKLTTMDEGDKTSRGGGLPMLPGLYHRTFQPSQRGFFWVHMSVWRERKPEAEFLNFLGPQPSIPRNWLLKGTVALDDIFCSFPSYL